MGLVSNLTYKYTLYDSDQNYLGVAIPEIEEPKLLYEPVENEIFKRKKLDNQITINRKNNKNLYDLIQTRYASYTYRDLYLIINLSNNGGVTYETTPLYTGICNYRTSDVDESNCKITFEFEPNDLYRPFLENKDIEYNILEVSSNISARSPIFSFLEFSPIDDGGKYFLVKIAAEDGFNPIFYPFALYARERVNYPFNDSNWTIQIDGDGNGFSIRQWLDNYINLKLNVEFGEINYENHPEGTWIKVAEFFRSTDRKLWAYGRISYLTNQEYTIEYAGFRKMSAVLGYLVNQLNPNVNFNENNYSKFFNDNGSTLAGGDEYENISIAQKSDILYPGGVAATKGMISFKDYINIYKAIGFFWYIDDSNSFRLEYYSDLPIFVQGIDATLLTNGAGVQWIEGTKAYRFASEEIEQREELLIGDSGNEDFIGLPVIYNTSSSNNQIKTYDIQYISTDIKNIQTNASQQSSSGFVVVQIEEAGAIIKYYQIVEDVGVLSSDTIVNANMSAANLMDKFWADNRLLKFGNLNGVDVEFNSATKTKIGKDITFPICSDILTYDALNQIQDLIGWGSVDKASYDFNSGKLTVNLKHDDNSLFP